MITLAEADKGIRAEFLVWCRDHKIDLPTTALQAHDFYTYFHHHRSDLLQFAYGGDKRERVHSLLVSAGLSQATD